MEPIKASLRKSRTLSPYLFNFIAFVFFVVVFYVHNYSSVSGEFRTVGPPSADHRFTSFDTSSDSVPVVSRAEDKREKEKEELLPFATGRAPEGCDVFSRRWTRDKSTRPLYQESECPYMEPKLTCQEHGRPDNGYQHWRWQPHDCNLPRMLNIETRKTILQEY